MSAREPAAQRQAGHTVVWPRFAGGPYDHVHAVIRQAGAPVPVARHDAAETVIVHRGLLRLEFDGAPPVEVGEGASVTIPAGLAHRGVPVGGVATVEVFTTSVPDCLPLAPLRPTRQERL